MTWGLSVAPLWALLGEVFCATYHSVNCGSVGLEDPALIFGPFGCELRGFLRKYH